MKPPRSYASPGSFRAAFKKKVVPERYQKLAVMHRFVLRVCRHFPRAVVKGGVALELRLARARTTDDIDVVISGDPTKTLLALREAARIDLGDFLMFEVEEDRAGRVIDTPGMHYRGARFVIRATFGGRSTPDFRFKLEATYDKVESFDVVPCRLHEFPQLEGGDLRIYPLPLQLAEKVHAYTDPNIRDDPKHSRYRDLVDIGLVAAHFAVDADALARDLKATFSRPMKSAAQRNTEQRGVLLHELPRALPPPPAAWSVLYDKLAHREDLPWATIHDVLSQARAFLDPVLARDVQSGRWDPARGIWSP
jgi:hypothetical protein